MGLGSIGIYSHELFLDYDVDCIIRIGTAGSYNEELEVGQLVMARESFCYSSEFNMLLLGEEVANRHLNQASREVNVLIADTARNLDIELKETRFHTTEVFYTKGKSIESLRAETGAELVEMESFALFATAESLNKRAATICAISDNIVTNEGMDASTRERGLKLLFRLALESAFEVSLRLKEGSF